MRAHEQKMQEPCSLRRRNPYFAVRFVKKEKNTKYYCLKRPPYCTYVQLVDNMEFVLVVVDREILALRVINRPLVALVVLIISARLYI